MINTMLGSEIAKREAWRTLQGLLLYFLISILIINQRYSCKINRCIIFAVRDNIMLINLAETLPYFRWQITMSVNL